MKFNDLSPVEKGLLIKKLSRGGYLKNIESNRLMNTVKNLYDNGGAALDFSEYDSSKAGRFLGEKEIAWLKNFKNYSDYLNRAAFKEGVDRSTWDRAAQYYFNTPEAKQIDSVYNAGNAVTEYNSKLKDVYQKAGAAVPTGGNTWRAKVLDDDGKPLNKNGMRMDTAVLDYIYSEAVRGGVDPKTAIAIAINESNLGNAHRDFTGDSNNAFNLMSYWAGINGNRYTNSQTSDPYNRLTAKARTQNLTEDEINTLNTVADRYRDSTSHITSYKGSNVIADAVKYFNNGSYQGIEPVDKESKEHARWEQRNSDYKALINQRFDEMLRDSKFKEWYESKLPEQQAQRTRFTSEMLPKINIALPVSVPNKFSEGGPERTDMNNEGGYSSESLENRILTHESYDPAGGIGILNQWMYGHNGSRGEEDQYYRAYLGLKNRVPKMNPNAKTEWDDEVEQKKKEKGQLPSEFYGTTPRMDLNIQALADTAGLRKVIDNYDVLRKEYPELAEKIIFEHALKEGKKVMEHPGEWTGVKETQPLGIKTSRKAEKDTNESSPLGMLANFGMKWVPEENAIYVHDTYDFPHTAKDFVKQPLHTIATWGSTVPNERPREMKIRSKISYDPKKGAVLLRDNLKNYNSAYPEAVKAEGGDLNIMNWWNNEGKNWYKNR